MRPVAAMNFSMFFFARAMHDTSHQLLEYVFDHPNFLYFSSMNFIVSKADELIHPSDF